MSSPTQRPSDASSASSANSITPPRLSVAMIVKNEAAALAETLESIESIADEIVIFDTGSSDATLQIAAPFSSTLVEGEWHDDFAAARNACLAKVHGDWVLWLDAGERLTPRGAEQLRQFVDQDADPRKAYMLLVQVPPQPGHVAGEQIGAVRLVPNYPGIRFTGRVREQIAPSLAEKGIELEGLPYRIQRGQRHHDPQNKLRKARRDLMLAQREIDECGESARLLNCVGDANQLLGEATIAVDCYRRAVAAAEPKSAEMLEAYYGVLSSLDGQPDARSQQLSVCVEALEHFPLDIQLLCAMGGYLQQLGRRDLATRAYQTASEYGLVHPQTWHLSNIQEVAVMCYSLSLQLDGKDEAARQALEAALARQGESVTLRRQLIELHVKHGRRAEALAQLEHLPLDAQQSELLQGALRGALLAAEKNWIPARSYLQAAYDGGCRDPLTLRWLSITLLSLECADEARRVLGEWQKREPGNVEPGQFLAAAADMVTGETSRQPVSGASAPARQFRVDGGGKAGTPATSSRAAAAHASERAR